MERLVIVSNRLPFSVEDQENDLEIIPSVGGLATGLKSFYKQYESTWIGWAGIEKGQYSPEKISIINQKFQRENCIPVYLDKKDIDLYYYGFSNNTIWPLFHYFTEYTYYKKDTWEAYKRVNRQFAEVIVNQLQPGDKLWIHDYHLLLLPAMIKKKFPDVSIGFFLHIPFPSSEIFRILPWREEILEGLLGSDLIGFHTYDYQRHFLSSIRRILGHDIVLNQVNLGERIIKVDSFPMGIDFDKFHEAAIQHCSAHHTDRSGIKEEIEHIEQWTPERKMILSIDRLDYTKGIPNRLLAYEHFLETYPEFHKKVVLVMLTVPSRTNVEQYQLMKKEVDEQVGRINGRFGTIDWTPVEYFYRSMPFDNLIELYCKSEVALLTPIRDGMNLVAKEYIASKTNENGVLILSEMAGASKELSEAIMINPNNMDEIARALKDALTMPEQDQKARIFAMQERLRRYNVTRWAEEFIDELGKVTQLQKSHLAKKMDTAIENDIIQKFHDSRKRIVFLDYDGTLVGFQKIPGEASPDNELYTILDKLAGIPDTDIVLISGRDKNTFEQWFGTKPYTLITEHGVWIKEPGNDWILIQQLKNDWKTTIRPLLEFYVDRTPGSFLEEKNYSLAWHYRKCDPELGSMRAMELKDELMGLIANHGLEIMEGNKVIEVKNSGVNKGRAAIHKIGDIHYEFILAIGDDWTDEYLFSELPHKAITIKVGLSNTQAKYKYESVNEVRSLLTRFVQ